MAIDGRKKRVEVSPKELGEEDQLRFAAAKDKEVKAWLHHRTVQKVAKGRIPDHAVMRCRWLLTWGKYWADVVSYPRHPEVTPSPWHTGLPQANRKLPQGPNPIGTLVPRHRLFGKQSS